MLFAKSETKHSGFLAGVLLFVFSLGESCAEVLPLQGDNIALTVSGALPVSTSNATISLPDIVITEKWKGALRPGSCVAIAAPSRVVAFFDASRATLRAYRPSDGVDITWAVLGGNRLIADPAPSLSNVADVVFKLASASTDYTGPAKLVISNLHAQLADYDFLGDLVLTVGGAEKSGGELDTLDKIASDLGSGASKKEVKVGHVVSGEGCRSCPPSPVVSGPLNAQTIHVGWGIVSGDIGKQGSVFVMAISSVDRHVYFQNSGGGWEPFTSCDTAPAYFTGTLMRSRNSDIPVVATPTDLTAYKGTDIYTGYGISGKTTACEQMMMEGYYLKVLMLGSYGGGYY